MFSGAPPDLTLLSLYAPSLGVAKKTLGLKFASGRPDRESTGYVHSKYTKINEFLYIWIPAHCA